MIKNKLAQRLPVSDTEVTLNRIALIDCFCCGIAKAQSFKHFKRHPELFPGDRQRDPKYLQARCVRYGKYPYEFLAVDIKPGLPRAYTGETII